MQEIQVWLLGREDPLEKEMATQSSILHGKSCGQRSLVGYRPWGHKRVGHDLVTKQNNNYCYLWASQLALMVKNQLANVGDIRDAGLIPGSGRSWEVGMATHSSILAWRIPWIEGPGGLQSIGCKESDTSEATEQTHMHNFYNLFTSWATASMELVSCLMIETITDPSITHFSCFKALKKVLQDNVKHIIPVAYSDLLLG